MTREKAIEIISQVRALMTMTGDKSPKALMAQESLDMAIKALEQEETGHWIPCSERLPQLDEFVLCAVPSENRVIIAIYQEEEFWFDGTITAWMSLPQPYKGVKE